MASDDFAPPPRQGPHEVPAEARFACRVRVTDSCWLWLGHKDGDGYGKLWVKDRNKRAHIYSYELFKGPVPDGLFVCHNCPGGDNPSCVNPSHLWLGTPQDNTLDALHKGRLKPRYGDAIPWWTKIADECVPAIRVAYAQGTSLYDLAAQHGVQPSTIYYIVTGLNRANLDGPRTSKYDGTAKHRNAKLANEAVHLIRLMAAVGIAQDAIAKQFGIEQTTVSFIVRYETWSDLWSPYTLPTQRAKQPCYKLGQEVVATILSLRGTGVTQKQVAAEFGVSKSRVGQIWRNAP